MAFTKVVGPGIHTLSNIASHNINSSGIITATKFVGPFDNAIIGGGTTISSDGINVTGIVTATGLDINGNGDISGNLVIGGNLTANGDFTTLNTTLREVELLRVDANSSAIAGIITQRGSGDILNLYDDSAEVFSVIDGGDVGIARSIFHLGDTNTSIGFDAADNIEFITGGSERLRINSAGNLEQTLTVDAQGFKQLAGANHYVYNIIDANRSAANDHILIQQGRWNGTNVAAMKFRAGTDTSNKDDGYITFETSSANNQTERLRITSDGDVNAATGHLQSQDLKLGLAADRYPIIQRAVQSSGSQNLSITGGSGYSEHTGSDHSLVDAREGALIQLGAGDPTSDTYGGYIKYFAHGHTSPNSSGVGNQHVFYTRSAANTNTERLRITSGGQVNILSLIHI